MSAARRGRDFTEARKESGRSMETVRARPILVTGSHRSGSTFVGRMIAAHPRIIYVSEPFNPGTYRGKTPLTQWWHQVTPSTEDTVRAWLRDPLTFRHCWTSDFRNCPSVRRLLGATRRKLTSWYRQATGCRPLLKDPIALFSAPWLARTYGTQVIVLIRHPAAFVSSLVRLGWHIPFTDLLAQPALMRDRLAPFEAEIRDIVERPRPILEQGILVWRIFHHVIRQYQQEHLDWLFVRHEDLSLRPVEGFAAVFTHLGLPMTPAVRSAIEAHTAAENPREAPEKVVHQLHRDSRANVWNWKQRLSPGDIEYIRKRTQDVASHFYADSEWLGASGSEAA